jgi:hypothetical protein
MPGNTSGPGGGMENGVLRSKEEKRGTRGFIVFILDHSPVLRVEVSGECNINGRSFWEARRAKHLEPLKQQPMDSL